MILLLFTSKSKFPTLDADRYSTIESLSCGNQNSTSSTNCFNIKKIKKKLLKLVLYNPTKVNIYETFLLDFLTNALRTLKLHTYPQDWALVLHSKIVFSPVYYPWCKIFWWRCCFYLENQKQN